jgi:beta-lactamase regulating signal transducer with metallopeptidase domain
MKTVDLLFPFLLNALWQVPALVLIASLGERLLGRSPARLRHALWLCTLALCVLLPAASLLPRAARPTAGGAAGLDLLLRATSGAAPLVTPHAAAGAERPFFSWAALAMLLWAVSMLGYAVRLGRAWLRTCRLARTALPDAMPERVAAIAERCRAAFGLERVTLRVSPRVTGPVTLGALWPAILLPPAFLAAPEDELVAGLGHEMAHLRRRDYLLNLSCEALLVPIAFHPAVRRLRRRLAETRETACDEATVERLLGARAYARSLLALAAAGAGLPRPSLTLGAHGADTADTLEVRMKRLVDPRPRPGARPALLRLGLALVLLAGAGLTASALAVQAPAAALPALSGDLSSFLGFWRGDFQLDKDGKDAPRPGLDLDVHQAGGQPQLAVAMYRYRRNDDGTMQTARIEMPVLSAAVHGRTLAFRTRSDHFRFGDMPEGQALIDWELRLDARGAAVLQGVRNSYIEEAKKRGVPVPPKDPGLEMKRITPR